MDFDPAYLGLPRWGREVKAITGQLETKIGNRPEQVYLPTLKNRQQTMAPIQPVKSVPLNMGKVVDITV